jgi:hypothetical protein
VFHVEDGKIGTGLRCNPTNALRIEFEHERPDGPSALIHSLFDDVASHRGFPSA